MTEPVAVVSGMVAGDPGQGGAVWAVLQYVLGLRRLGFDVVLIEPMRLTPGDAARLDYFDEVREFASLKDRACVLDLGDGEVHGMDRRALQALAQRAEILLNISGMLPLEAPFDGIPVRAYLDLDPAFNQLWHAAEGIDLRFSGHTHHITVGLRMGDDSCRVPTCDVDWITTLPPVVLDEWPVAGAVALDALTTVGHWRSYGAIEHEGTFYGQKAHSMRELLGLAARSPKQLLPALAIDPAEIADLAALGRDGWQLLDPAEIAATPDSYRQFVSGSLGELGITKSGYVTSRCGWFSDRSACYLASGRPVLAQDTGFGELLPVGDGLLTFGCVDDAAAGIIDILARYDDHRRAARDIAEDVLDSDKVLSRLLQRTGAR